MILTVNISEKSFGDKELYSNLRFEVEDNEKVGLIGRNGTGKSTLFHLITGNDQDYQGSIIIKRDTTVISSRQEHHQHEHKTVMEYILGDLPEFEELHHIISTYPETMGENRHKQQKFSDALERFNQLGYFQIEEEITQAFRDYQIDTKKLDALLGDLSGGQKRMVELIKVQRSRGHLALIDEPTNHMDYVAKQSFIKWLVAAPEAVIVITHDRDVLKNVSRIIEIRDGQAFTFKGNYESYLKINKNQITSQVNEYSLAQRRIQNLEQDLIRFRRLKEKARDPGTIKRFKSQEEKVSKELKTLYNLEKPSFWIDRASSEELNPKIANAYKAYKAKNIRLSTKNKDSDQDQNNRLLIDIKQLSLGYNDHVLFDNINFSLHEGEKLRLHGRNGAGKTTLIQAILSKAYNSPSEIKQFKGNIVIERDLKIGVYDQEISNKFLNLKLADAIEKSLMEKNVPVSDQKVKQLLNDYLFNPNSDGETLISRLSGGQKARFQLIRMLLGQPQLLILDEPTNHLDLPSIEELEDALSIYQGAIIYISHDSVFAKHLSGEVINIGT